MENKKKMAKKVHLSKRFLFLLARVDDVLAGDLDVRVQLVQHLRHLPMKVKVVNISAIYFLNIGLGKETKFT